MSILQMSVSASILTLFIIVIRAVLLNKLPQKTFIILWGVALFRLLIPISVPSQFSVFTLIKNLTSLPAAQKIGIPSPNMGIAETMPATVTNGVLQMSVSPLLILWLVGMLAVALSITITHLRCRQSYKMALPTQNAFLAKWKKEHPTRRTIQIKQSDKITAPLTYGIVRPVILLPKSMNNADECKLQYVLAHEFTHIKRFDVLLKCLLAASLCVHWFNPLVWVMYVLANRDIEISCDEAVVKTFGETTKSAYALTLISLEEKKSRLNPLCNNFSKNAIEERITSIMEIKKTSLAGVALALVLVAGTTTVFATSASAAPQNREDGVKTYSYTGKNGNNGMVAGENVKHPERLNTADLDENQSFITNEDATRADAQRMKPRVRTEEELKQIIADIESGKIKPLDITALPDDVTVTIVDSDGKETVLKQSGAVKDGSAMDTSSSK